MPKTSIEWTDYSWPIVNGCRRVSAGCEHCYAERLSATRLRNHPKYSGLAAMRNGHPSWTGKTRLWEPALSMPLGIKKPSRIFVADMGDLFYEGVPDEVIDRVFAVMTVVPRHTFQVLTKRPARMREYLSSPATSIRLVAMIHAITQGLKGTKLTLEDNGDGFTGLMLPNVWLGVSVEDQATADERIPLLLQTPAAVRFVSYEPALSGVDFSRFFPKALFHCWRCGQELRRPDHPACDTRDNTATNELSGIDWIIVGGESGPGARGFDLRWARETVKQCAAAGAPVFVKQLGARPYEYARPASVTDEERTAWHRDGWCNVVTHGGEFWQKIPHLRDRKGGDWLEWPEDLRVRQFPEARA